MNMLRLALFFLIIALIAGALNLGGVAYVSSEIGWTLFVVFLVLAVISFLFGQPWRTGPPSV